MEGLVAVPEPEDDEGNNVERLVAGPEPEDDEVSMVTARRRLDDSSTTKSSTNRKVFQMHVVAK